MIMITITTKFKLNNISMCWVIEEKLQLLKISIFERKIAHIPS